jgi:predicted HicB family RNase H-like nuclease
MSKVNLIVRFEKRLHSQLVKLAKERHQSLNGLINSVVESEVKKSKKKLAENLE